MKVLARDLPPAATRPVRRFPLIRHLSWRLTAVLLRFPVSANQITLAGLVLGLAASWFFLRATLGSNLVAAALFVASYLCSHCDGEVARLKRLESRFGDGLSELCGFVVHAALLLALGENAYKTFGHEIWRWLGYVAAAGTALTFVVDVSLKAQPAAGKSSLGDLSHTIGPTDVVRKTRWSDHALYVFRELMAADFCFVLLAVSVVNVPWLLLPAAAVGTHVYWMTGFCDSARKFHV